MEDIKSIDYFKSLNEGILNDVVPLFKEENYEAGENIFIEGEKSKGIYFVMRGAVKVYKSSKDGREQILKLIYAGDSFNDVTAFTSDINPASADAVTNVKLYLLSRENIIGLIYKHPEISLNIIKSMTEKLRYLTGRIEDLSLKHTQERIAKILLLFEGKKLSQKIIADIAGTAREVVSRALKDFSSRGIVKIDKRDIIILDKKKLKDLGES
jgi:CRP/FNR family transcriptional regulator